MKVVRRSRDSRGTSSAAHLGTARGAEMLLPVWLRLMGALDTARFNVVIVC